MMAHRKLGGPDDVAEYANYLDEGWPARQQVIDHLCGQLQGMATKPLKVLELCTGPGALSQQILDRVPVAKYVGIDISPASMQYVQELTQELNIETHWLAADLNGDEWIDLVENDYDAVVALQSVHDLGGEAEVRRIYRVAQDLLQDGGLFINADLLRNENDPLDKNPGRFSIQRHEQMLFEAGFTECECTLELDGFGCLEATK